MDMHCCNCGRRLSPYGDENFCGDECRQEYNEIMQELAEDRYYNPDDYEDTSCIEPSDY
jgi:hypothetical protein